MSSIEGAKLVVVFFFVGIVIVYVLYLNSLRKTIIEISPENRRVRPGEVWLMLIPLFSLVWQFVLVAKIADSLLAEYRSRGMTPSESRPGYQLGLTMSVCFVSSLLPLLGSIIALIGFICWILYWNKMNSYRQELENMNSVL